MCCVCPSFNDIHVRCSRNSTTDTEKQYITILAAKILSLQTVFQKHVSSLMEAILLIPDDIIEGLQIWVYSKENVN